MCISKPDQPPKQLRHDAFCRQWYHLPVAEPHLFIDDVRAGGNANPVRDMVAASKALAFAVWLFAAASEILNQFTASLPISMNMVVDPLPTDRLPFQTLTPTNLFRAPALLQPGFYLCAHLRRKSPKSTRGSAPPLLCLVIRLFVTVPPLSAIALDLAICGCPVSAQFPRNRTCRKSNSAASKSDIARHSSHCDSSSTCQYSPPFSLLRNYRTFWAGGQDDETLSSLPRNIRCCTSIWHRGFFFGPP